MFECILSWINRNLRRNMFIVRLHILWSYLLYGLFGLTLSKYCQWSFFSILWIDRQTDRHSLIMKESLFHSSWRKHAVFSPYALNNPQFKKWTWTLLHHHHLLHPSKLRIISSNSPLVFLIIISWKKKNIYKLLFKVIFTYYRKRT